MRAFLETAVREFDDHAVALCTHWASQSHWKRRHRGEKQKFAKHPRATGEERGGGMENAPDAILDIVRGLTTVRRAASATRAPGGGGRLPWERWTLSGLPAALSWSRSASAASLLISQSLGDLNMELWPRLGAGRVLHGRRGASAGPVAPNLPERVFQVPRDGDDHVPLLPRHRDAAPHARPALGPPVPVGAAAIRRPAPSRASGEPELGAAAVLLI